MAAPAVAVGDIILVLFKQRMYAQTIMNVLHYKVTDTGNPPGLDLDILGIDLFTEMYNATKDSAIGHKMLITQSRELTHEELWVQRIYPIRNVKRVGIAGFVGLDQGASLPPNSAATITKYTDLAKRNGIGSFHLGGMPSNATTVGLWLGPNLQKLKDVGTALVKQQVIGTYSAKLDPILWHGTGPNPTSQLVNNFKAQETIRVERRRTVGVGI